MRIESVWPPFGITVRSGDLTLRIARPDDVEELVDVVLSGIHPPDLMPFSVAWTDQPEPELPAAYYRYLAQTIGHCTPEDWSLQFVVRRDQRIVGVQGLEAASFPQTRTAETGSWLALSAQGKGIGTRMRQAVCAFAFDQLGAKMITSGAFTDNAASLAVSAKVGYRANGRDVVLRRGVGADHLRLLLEPEYFIRGEPVEVSGAAGLRKFLGVQIEDKTV